jgi:hypothetical protein
LPDKKKSKSKLSKEPTWDEIGRAVGRKIEKYKMEECSPWRRAWFFREREGGGFGRFVFITGLLYALNLLGSLPDLPLWVWIWVVIGFTAMKF